MISVIKTPSYRLQDCMNCIIHLLLDNVKAISLNSMTDMLLYLCQHCFCAVGNLYRGDKMRFWWDSRNRGNRWSFSTYCLTSLIALFDISSFLKCLYTTLTKVFSSLSSSHKCCILWVEIPDENCVLWCARPDPILFLFIQPPWTSQSLNIDAESRFSPSSEMHE